LIYPAVSTFVTGHWRHYYQENWHGLDYWYLWWANDSRAMQFGGGEARRLPGGTGLLSLSYAILAIGHLSSHFIWFCNLWACACTWRIACSE